MGPIGMQEMIALFVIALLLFGPKKLPELGRTLGKALTEFRRAKSELTKTFETHMQELERETRIEPVKEFQPASYSYPYDDSGRYEEPVSQIAAAPVPQAPVTQTEPTVSVYDVPPAAVPGTVARTNGVQPVTAATSEGEHRS